jgi:hypothetical protein
MFFSDFRSCLLGARNRPSGPRGDTLKPKRNSEKMKLNVSRVRPHSLSSVFRRQSQNQPCAWGAINSRKGTDVKSIVEIRFINYSNLLEKGATYVPQSADSSPSRGCQILHKSWRRNSDRIRTRRSKTQVITRVQLSAWASSGGFPTRGLERIHAIS